MPESLNMEFTSSVNTSTQYSMAQVFKRKRASSDGTLPTPPFSDCDWRVEDSLGTMLDSADRLLGTDSAESVIGPKGHQAKRQRTSDCDTRGENEDEMKVLERATHVLSTQAAALAHVTKLYQTQSSARKGLTAAVDAILKAHHSLGKLIVCGVGKSAYISMKLVASCKSLGIGASFMHACEAAHGDLGDVRTNDVLLFISYSGKSPELLNLLPHISPTTPIMALTSHTNLEDCPLLADRTNSILLPAPIHELEERSFGVTAPTTSTTVALAVADMLALTVAEELHSEEKRDVFKRNHPGGAIGMNHKEVELLKSDGIDVTVLELPSPSISGEDDR